MPTKIGIHPRTDDEIRRRFITSLGIKQQQQQPTTTTITNGRNSKRQKKFDTVLSESTTIVEVPLKNHCEQRDDGEREPELELNFELEDVNPNGGPTNGIDDADTVAAATIGSGSSSNSSSSNNGSSRRRRIVTFDPVVKSIQIPSHREYSERAKRLIWSNLSEIQRNAKRNYREFFFEECSPKKVLEEDQMYLDMDTMEFIHPAHILPVSSWYSFQGYSRGGGGGSAANFLGGKAWSKMKQRANQDDARMHYHDDDDGRRRSNTGEFVHHRSAVHATTTMHFSSSSSLCYYSQGNDAARKTAWRE